MRKTFRRAVLALLMFISGIPGTSAGAESKGFLIYSEHGVSDPTLIEFQSIQWKDGREGVIQRVNGKSQSFVNPWIKRIVYLNPLHFKAIQEDSKIQPMRAHIRSREIPVNPAPREIAEAEDAQNVSKDISALSTVAKEFPLCAKLVEPIANSLRQELARYQKGELKLEGRWLSVTEVAERKARLEAEAAKQAKALADALKAPARMKFTFSTRSGKTFSGASLSSVDRSDFSVMTDTGIVRISFADLLDDLSDLPPEITEPVEKLRAEEKEKELARKQSEEQREMQEKANQTQAGLAKKTAEEQKRTAAEQALEAANREQVAKADAAAQARLAEQQKQQAAATAGAESTPASAQPTMVLAATPTPQPSPRSGTASQQSGKPLPAEAPQCPLLSNPLRNTALEGVLLAPLVIISGYLLRFKRTLPLPRRIGTGLGLYLLALGLLIPAVWLIHQAELFDLASTRALVLIAVGSATFSAILVCSLAEAISRMKEAKAQSVADPALAQVYLESAVSKYQHRDFDGAVADCTKAIEINPGFAAAYSLRGAALNDSDEKVEAIIDYTKAIELEPETAHHYYNRANIRHDRGYTTQALADYTKAIELDPNAADCYNNRAAVYLAKKELELAIQDFSRAIELNPDSASAFANRAAAYLQKEDSTAALADFTKALELDPSLKDEITPQIEALQENQGTAENQTPAVS